MLPDNNKRESTTATTLKRFSVKDNVSPLNNKAA